jgi:hypothetical protein
MQLTAEQLETVEQGHPLRFSLPGRKTELVIVRADWFDKVTDLVQGDQDDPDSCYPLLADISPEDWEDGSAYGVVPSQKK